MFVAFNQDICQHLVVPAEYNKSDALLCIYY